MTNQAPPVEIKTLRDFFLTGWLCHKPPVRRLFTFDAFRFTPEDRDRLAGLIAGEAGVPYARPRTEGFGFSLKSALKTDGIDEESPDVQRTQYRRASIDTTLGFWMPSAYAADIGSRIHNDEEIRLDGLARFAEALCCDQGRRRATDAFHEHVSSMNDLIAKHQIQAHPVKDRDVAFRRFLSSRMQTLANDESRARLARILTLTPMPDIWEDARAVKEFEESFFDDLVYRLGSDSGAGGRIIRSIGDALNLYGTESSEDIREALEQRLHQSAWADNEWQE